MILAKVEPASSRRVVAARRICDIHRPHSALAQRGTAYSAWELEYRFSKLWELKMTLGTILLIVLILILIGVIPTWPHSSGWGYYPAGGIGTILVIVLILLLLGRL